MWGQALYILYASIYLRIIPTRVGTRWIAVINQAVNEDHPHACGDKERIGAVFHVRQGSSPRVWGQGKDTQNLNRRNRIIPTRVGTSSSLRQKSMCREDHPHACGDKLRSPYTLSTLGRIIPTRVGTRLAGKCHQLR